MRVCLLLRRASAVLQDYAVVQAKVIIGLLVLSLSVLASGSAAATDPPERGTVRSDLDDSFITEPTIDDIVEAHRLHDRIVGGVEATKGQWPSMVAIYVRRPGRAAFNFCGGTVIGKEWVLTAAHCAAAMKRAQSSEPGVSFFIREGTSDLNATGFRDINVTNIVSHDAYNPKLTLNDVALLKLSGQASAPRQKLLGRAMIGNTLVERKKSTVIGFGLTQEGGSASARLRQVDVPIVGQPACKAVYGGDAITDANFCAGEKEGGKDSCQGDSGGPLFAPDRTGRHLQAGVVSWGKGCARPEFYGVYASVGNFQDWIKARVRDADFVEGTGGSRPSDTVTEAAATLAAGATETDKPSQLAQVTIDIAEGDRVKVGSFIEVRVTSSVSGAVVVYNENPDGHSYQLYPSEAFPAPGSNPSVARIEAGKVLSIPSRFQRDQGYRFVIKPPTGINRLRAVVVPESSKVQDIISAHAHGGEIRDLGLVINQIVDAELETRGPEAIKIFPVNRGSAEKVYEIVP